MKLLLLGGTQFVGLHMTQAALDAGHEVTLFNRGNTNPDLFPGVERLRGDRDGGLDALKGRTWDAVLDVNGYLPRVVRDSAALLADAVERYVFISTISVYADFSQPNMDEDSTLATLPDDNVEQLNGGTYGALKVLCEQAAEEIFPGRALVIRPGYVVGPHDHTDRFTYWMRRVAKGGEMLAPGTPDTPHQFIDGRDLGAWTVRMTEQKRTGIFNATGPDYKLTWGAWLEAAKQVTGSDATFTWVSEAFLREQEVGFADLPMWSPSSDVGGMTTNCAKAIAAGLTYRPLADTIRDTLAWDTAHGTKRSGITPEREAEVLAAWRSANS